LNGLRNSLRGFRKRRDAHAAARPDLGGLVVLTAQGRDVADLDDMHGAEGMQVFAGVRSPMM
jgi:hypothetical protein